MANTTRSEVRRRLKRGQKVRKIAESLGISTQAVYLYRKEFLANGELPMPTESTPPEVRS